MAALQLVASRPSRRLDFVYLLVLCELYVVIRSIKSNYSLQFGDMHRLLWLNIIVL